MAQPEDETPRGDGPWHSGKNGMRGTARAEVTEDQGPIGRTIDRIGHGLASPYFFMIFFAVHLLWIPLNLRAVPGLEPWDPYPFTLLATIASVEAPIVALLILMRQQRDRIVDEIRDEVILQLTLHVERESTELLRMVGALGDRLEVDFENADDLAELQKELDPESLISALEEVEEEPPGE